MKIVIIEGGTAGWLSALMISKVYPDIGLWIYVLAGLGKINKHVVETYIANNRVEIIGLNNLSDVIKGFDQTTNNILSNHMKYSDLIKFIQRKNKE